MAAPDREVGVLAGLERPDPAIDTELLGRVDRHHVQGIDLGHAAVAHGLGGLEIESAGEFVAVGVERRHHAAPPQDRAVVGDAVDDLVLVSPPVGERRCAGAVSGDFVRHLVALENVLQRCDPEPEPFRQVEQHEDFVGAVGVGVHLPLAVEDLENRLELQVAARLDVRGRVTVVVGTCRSVVEGGAEALVNRLFDAHARLRIAPTVGGCVAPVALLRVLAERELDSRWRVSEDEILGFATPAQLDDLVLTADRVRRAVEDVRHREPTRELPVDRDVLGVEHVGNAHLAGDDARTFVDRSGDRGV